MFRYAQWVALASSTLVLIAVLGTGCGTRVETPAADADSTLVYAPQDGDGVTASISLCRRISRKSGRPLGVGRVFSLGEGAKVQAHVALENLAALGERGAMFHLVWLGPKDKEIYTKRIDWTPSDSTATLSTSLSIPPDRREPGKYTFKVYLFRELIAEKRFVVQDPVPAPEAGLRESESSK